MIDNLNKQLSELASRLNNLAASYTDATSRTLLELNDRLIDLSNEAIAKSMQANDANYEQALMQINKAIAIIGDGNTKIDKVTEVISIVGKAIDFAAKAITMAG